MPRIRIKLRGHEQTGVAMSSDLKHWERYEGNPVLVNGPSGALDEYFASEACVMRITCPRLPAASAPACRVRDADRCDAQAGRCVGDVLLRCEPVRACP